MESWSGKFAFMDPISQHYEVLPSFTRTASVPFQECSDKSNKNSFNSDIVESKAYTLLFVDSSVGTVTTGDKEIRVIFPPVTQCVPLSKVFRLPLGPCQVFLRPEHEADQASSGLYCPCAVMD